MTENGDEHPDIRVAIARLEEQHVSTDAQIAEIKETCHQLEAAQRDTAKTLTIIRTRSAFAVAAGVLIGWLLVNLDKLKKLLEP